MNSEMNNIRNGEWSGDYDYWEKRTCFFIVFYIGVNLFKSQLS